MGNTFGSDGLSRGCKVFRSRSMQPRSCRMKLTEGFRRMTTDGPPAGRVDANLAETLGDSSKLRALSLRCRSAFVPQYHCAIILP
jgi:hypothetical protein